MDKEAIKKVLRLRNEIVKELADQQKKIDKDKKLTKNKEVLAFLEGKEKQIMSTIFILDKVMNLKNIVEALKDYNS